MHWTHCWAIFLTSVSELMTQILYPPWIFADCTGLLWGWGCSSVKDRCVRTYGSLREHQHLKNRSPLTSSSVCWYWGLGRLKCSESARWDQLSVTTTYYMSLEWHGYKMQLDWAPPCDCILNSEESAGCKVLVYTPLKPQSCWLRRKMCNHWGMKIWCGGWFLMLVNWH